MNSPPPETCLSRKTPFQYCLIAILCVTVPFFFILFGIHVIYQTTNFGHSEKCENLCYKLRKEFNTSEGSCELITEQGSDLIHVTYRNYVPIMNFEYKNNKTFQERKLEALHMIRENSDFIPVIIEKDPGSPLSTYGDPVTILKIPKNQTGFELKKLIASKIGTSESEVHLYVNDEIMTLTKTMGEIYNKSHEQDKVLYVAYSDIVNSKFKERNVKLTPKMHFKYKKEHPFRKRLLHTVHYLINSQNHIPMILEKDPTCHITTSMPVEERFQADKKVKDLYHHVAHKLKLRFVWLFVRNKFVEDTSEQLMKDFYLDNYDDDNYLYVAYTDNPETLFVPKEDYDKIPFEVSVTDPPLYTHSKVPFLPPKRSYRFLKRDRLSHMLKTRPGTFMTRYQLVVKNKEPDISTFKCAKYVNVRIVLETMHIKYKVSTPLYIYTHDKRLDKETTIYSLIDKYVQNDNYVYVYITDNPNLLD